MKTTSLPIVAAPAAYNARNSSTDLDVFLAYDSLAAALRASDSLMTLSRRAGDGLRLQLSPWSFACLASLEWRSQARLSLESAHLIVITSCSKAPTLPVVIDDWLRSCLPQRREESVAVAALFYDGDWLDEPRSPRLRSVQRLVEELGCVFFAPHLAQNVTAVTPS